MYNRARFNLQRFNLPSDVETDIVYLGEMREILNCAIGYGEDSFLAETAAEQVRSLVALDPCVHLSGTVGEGLQSGVDMAVDFLPLVSMLEAFSHHGYLSADGYQRQTHAESVLNALTIGGDAYQQIALSDGILCLCSYNLV